jgi:hypothetical protein
MVKQRQEEKATRFFPYTFPITFFISKRSVADPDPHQSKYIDPNPHQSQKQEPDPHRRQKFQNCGASWSHELTQTGPVF